MPRIVENNHLKRIKDLGINIKTTYISNGNLLERNTDNSKNENVSDGVLFEKEYFYKGKCLHKETEFDTRMEYSFVTDHSPDEEYTCPNCGVTKEYREFEDGCPYCKSYYNIDFKDKELGGKNNYDRVLRSNVYKVVTLIVDMIISFLLAFLFIKFTSRTFNGYDVSKILVIGAILTLVLYFVFYLLDAYVVLGPIKKIKDRENKKQMEFWNRTKYDKKKFFNNFNCELDRVLYRDLTLIDYDIIDYDKFEDYVKDDIQYVNITVYMRLVYFSNDRITSKLVQNTYLLKKNNSNIIETKDGINLIKCPGCGASVDALSGTCSFCKNELGSIQEWLIVQ